MNRSLMCANSVKGQCALPLCRTTAADVASVVVSLKLGVVLTLEVVMQAWNL